MALSSARSVAGRRAIDLLRVSGLAVGAWADVLLVGTLLALAGAVRWPHLLLSPQFPSVGDTIMMALNMAEGRAFYLADSAPYLGAPFIWLLALVYRVFGPSIEATMLLAWTLGVLTIVPTYLLGREIGGRGAGVIAAVFLATSGAHTVVTSHVALSHSLTPLVSTTALWLVARAVNHSVVRPPGRARDGESGAGRLGLDVASMGSWKPAPTGGHVGAGFQRPTGSTDHPDLPALQNPMHATSGIEVLARGGRLLALAGLVAGLALQTHPTSAPLLVGGALGALLARPAWLRTRWPVLAVAMVLVGYSTLLVYHVTSRFEIVADIESKQERYLDSDQDDGEEAEHGVYVNNLEQLGLATTRLVGGALADRPTASSYLQDPWIMATVGLALAGIVIAARQRHWWLVGAVVLAVFLPPAFSGKYRPVLDGRYLMPLVPVLFVAIALAAATIARSIAGINLASPTLQFAPRLARGVALLVLAGGMTLLVAHPLELLDTFYEDSQEDGFSNSLYLRTLQEIEAARQGDEPVLLDPMLMTVKSTGGGKASSSFTFLLALAQVPYESLNTGRSGDLVGRLAILQRSTADHLDDTLRLEPLDGKRQNGKDSPSYRAYRIGPIEASRR